MRSPALPSPRRLAAGAGLALLAAGLTPIAASANPAGTELVISEVYGAGGNNGALFNADFVELANPTDSPISLAGKYLHYRSATGGSGGAPFALSGTVPANSTWLVQMSAAGANGAALDADQTVGTFTMAGAGGQVFLLSQSTAIATNGNMVGTTGVLDMVGASGSTSFETAATSGSASTTQSLNRTQDTDNNTADFVLAAPSPTKSSAGNPDGPTVGAVGNKSFVVDEPITPFTVSATGGTAPYEWSATDLPAGLSIDAASGEVSGTPTAIGTSSVTVTATDAEDETGSVTFDIAVTPAAGAITPIAQIQGTGATTPLNGQTVTTQGVVTASYPTGGLNGFYIQTPGADTPDASDAVFVYGGSNGFADYPAVGDSVEVTGTANEFSGATQITADTVTDIADLGDVTPKTEIPGTDCALPGTACLSGAALDTAREVAEGELFQPTAPWTATDVYDGGPYYNDGSNSTAFRGELGVAANTDEPLVAPTEIIDAQATALVAERKKYNDAHRIILDDGSSWTYSTTVHANDPFPWFTEDHTVRVGAAITFPKPVVFTFGFNAWRILPQSQVVGDPSGTIDFEQTRPDAPENVGGDLKLATFNVLNFFPTTGEEFVSSGLGTCTYYTDRAGNRISNNRCDPNGPRGAANDANLARQRDKIVAAINTADADVVSLEELENSVKFGKNRDFAINALVAALNADAGAGTWAAVPSPATLPPLAEQDVIRNGFIYKPAKVALVGESVVLSDQSSAGEAFEDAREPLAQAFKKVGTPNSDAFAVIVNHFKSKGSGTPDPDGQGNANDRRKLQAEGLVTFAEEFEELRGVDKVFLAGDFNAYSEEDPIQILEAAGYTNLDSDTEGEESYNFDGMVGSLDHVLANAEALAAVEGVDVWDINAYESVYYEYARYNTNVTNLYAPNPYRSSDHNPEIVGINVDSTATEVQIIGTNDYHGRLAAGPRLAAAVKAARQANPNTVFAAAGDLVGATTFESFIQHDKPTIDVMNEAGLDVSAVGNHEFDQGYDDLVDRIMAPYDETDNPEGGAEWQYLGANVKFKDDGSDALEGTWIRDFGDVEVGFIGAVTEDLPSLVGGDGIADIEVTDIVDATNAAAEDLTDEGADVIVLLVHEGAATPALSSATNPSTAFGEIVNGVSPDVDAIISGHTHQAYNHSVPVPAWETEGRAVTERPVVSAGQYGENLNKLVFTVDNATGEVQAKTQQIVAAADFPATGDPATQEIVTAANAEAAVLGAQPLGKIAAGFSRAKFVGGAENRGGESSLGNLVAEVQRWATDADIAFMNPGGLRADMTGTGTDFPRTVTYKNAADVQPFANTLMTMGLTGSSIKKVLEQQWQRNANGTIPARPFLKLGVSEGFKYTYDPSRPEGDRITGMWLDGVKIEAGTTYQVAANSFLASGTGDNFFAFSEATGKRDSGKVDLQTMVDYMAEFAPESDPLDVDFAQRAVGVSGLAADYLAGQTATVNLTSLAMTGSGDKQDSVVTVELAGQPVGEFAVDNTANAAGDANSNDEAGKATVSFQVPALAAGTHTLVITGATTGTSISLPFVVRAAEPPAKADTSVTGTADKVVYGKAGSVVVKVAPASATGTVTVVDGTRVLGTATLASGQATVALAKKSLSVGSHTLSISYAGDAGHKASTGTVTVKVVKAKADIDATVKTKKIRAGKTKAKIVVKVDAAGVTPTGKVTVKVGGETYKVSLKKGRAMVKLDPFAKPGTYQAKIAYPGDENTKSATTKLKVTVTRR